MTLPLRSETSLLIVFCDLTRFQANASKTPDLVLADIMDAHYQQVAARLVSAGGRIIKFIGDATLAVFPVDLTDAAVLALLDLKHQVDAWFAGQGWDSRLTVKAHVGMCAAGLFGPPQDQHFDVIGAAVNTAATLPGRGFSISADAFRKLLPHTRQRFQKHTAPVVYIPVGTPRP